MAQFKNVTVNKSFLTRKNFKVVVVCKAKTIITPKAPAQEGLESKIGPYVGGYPLRGLKHLSFPLSVPHIEALQLVETFSASHLFEFDVKSHNELVRFGLRLLPGLKTLKRQPKSSFFDEILSYQPGSNTRWFRPFKRLLSVWVRLVDPLDIVRKKPMFEGTDLMLVRMPKLLGPAFSLDHGYRVIPQIFPTPRNKWERWKSRVHPYRRQFLIMPWGATRDNLMPDVPTVPTVRAATVEVSQGSRLTAHKEFVFNQRLKLRNKFYPYNVVGCHPRHLLWAVQRGLGNLYRINVYTWGLVFSLKNGAPLASLPTQARRHGKKVSPRNAGVGGLVGAGVPSPMIGSNNNETAVNKQSGFARGAKPRVPSKIVITRVVGGAAIYRRFRTQGIGAVGGLRARFKKTLGGKAKQPVIATPKRIVIYTPKHISTPQGGLNDVGKVKRVKKRRVWGYGFTLIGRIPTQEQLVTAMGLLKAWDVQEVPVPAPRAVIPATFKKKPAKVLPVISHKPGAINTARIRMWSRRWVWTRRIRRTKFEKLTRSTHPFTKKRLRLIGLKAQVRVRLAHLSVILLDKYRALLRQPIVAWAHIRARIRRAHHRTFKKKPKVVLTRATKRRRRLVNRKMYTHMLWWRYRSTLTPRSIELFKYKTYFTAYPKVRLPWSGFRGEGVYLLKKTRKYRAYGSRDYVSTRWYCQAGETPDYALRALRYLAHARIKATFTKKVGRGALRRPPVKEHELLTKHNPPRPSVLGKWRITFIRRASTNKSLYNIQALVCVVYYNTIIGLLRRCRLGEPSCRKSLNYLPTHINTGGVLSRGGVPTTVTETPVTSGPTQLRVPRVRYNRAKPFLWLGGTMLIRDLEHYLGAPIYLILDRMGTQGESTNFYILRYCFFIKFGWISRFFVAPLHEAYLAAYYAGVHHDLDLLCKFFQEVLSSCYYAHSPKLFVIYSQMLCYMWPMYVRYGAGVGLFFELKGKFHRYMTIESQSKRLRLGKTSHGTTNYALAFRYRQGVNETGAFGIHLHLLSKNEVRVFSDKV